MKYDIIIANPPYKAGLHLKFLDKALDLREEDGHIVFVHPAEWLVQKRETIRNKHFPPLRAKVKGAHIKFIQNPWPKQAALWPPVAVTHIRGNDFRFTLDGYWFKFETQKVKDLDGISMIGYSDLGVKVVKRILAFAKTSNWKSNLTDSPNEKIYLNLFNFSGHNDDFTKVMTIVDTRTALTFRDPNIAITDKPLYTKNGNPRYWAPFTNREEAINAHNFLINLKLIQVFIAIIKIDQNAFHTLGQFIPWLDWTQEWTDEKLYDLFSITEEEQQEISRLWALISENK
jgi:hypothetical protein